MSKQSSCSDLLGMATLLIFILTDMGFIMGPKEVGDALCLNMPIFLKRQILIFVASQKLKEV